MIFDASVLIWYHCNSPRLISNPGTQQSVHTVVLYYAINQFPIYSTNLSDNSQGGNNGHWWCNNWGRWGSCINPLDLERCGSNFASVFFKLILWIDALNASCKIGLRQATELNISGFLIFTEISYIAIQDRHCTPMGLLPDMWNCGLCMRQKCRERFPRRWLQRKPLVSDPGMRAVMHVRITNPWWWWKHSLHSRRMRNMQIYVSVKRPIRLWDVYEIPRIMQCAI